MVYFIILVRKFALIKALNMNNKIFKASNNTLNRYFQKTHVLCEYRRPYESVLSTLAHVSRRPFFPTATLVRPSNPRPTGSAA